MGIHSRNRRSGDGVRFVKNVIVVAIVTSVVFLVWFWNRPVHRADRYVRKAATRESALDRAGYLDKAAAIYEGELLKSPRNVKLILRLADVYYLMGRFDRATLYFRNARSLNEGKLDPENYAKLGMAYYKSGEAYYSDAIEPLEQAVAGGYTSLDGVDLRGVLGALYVNNSDYERGLSKIDSALADNPNDAEAHYAKGNLLKDAKNYSGAMEEYKIAIKNNPNHLGAHYALGWLYYREDKLDEAIAEYKFVLTRDPNHVNAQYWLGKVYKKMGRWGEAVEAWKRVLEIDPNNKEARDQIEDVSKRM
ncbi:MAG: tetratricopeptide repeat protein [bacterium]